MKEAHVDPRAHAMSGLGSDMSLASPLVVSPR